MQLLPRPLSTIHTLTIIAVNWSDRPLSIDSHNGLLRTARVICGVKRCVYATLLEAALKFAVNVPCIYTRIVHPDIYIRLVC